MSIGLGKAFRRFFFGKVVTCHVVMNDDSMKAQAAFALSHIVFLLEALVVWDQARTCPVDNTFFLTASSTCS